MVGLDDFLGGFFLRVKLDEEEEGVGEGTVAAAPDLLFCEGVGVGGCFVDLLILTEIFDDER